MKKEDIEKAAEEYEDSLTYSSVKEQYDVQKAFEAGAEWFLNKIWHKPDEVPDRSINDDGVGEPCLIKISLGVYEIADAIYDKKYHMYFFDTSLITFHLGQIECYAYINDLIPTKS